MREWLEKHREAAATGALIGLLSLTALGVVALFLRTPAPSPIVIQSITPLPTATREPTATPQPIQVYVTGAVAQPGVYALPWDCRVQQAITAAGGAAADADLLRVNLAQRLYDEDQVYIPHLGEASALPVPPLTRADPPATATSSRGVNINTAPAEELIALPGIGPALAQRVIDYREANGPYQSKADIKKVKGIGDGIFAQIQDLITTE